MISRIPFQIFDILEIVLKESNTNKIFPIPKNEASNFFFCAHRTIHDDSHQTRLVHNIKCIAKPRAVECNANSEANSDQHGIR